MSDYSILINTVNAHKSEALLCRDEKDYTGAIEELESAVAIIDESDWEKSPSSTTKPTADQKAIAFHLADCLGMIGGNYRRLEQWPKALEYFKRGSEYEEDERYDVNSSYSLVNSITIPIENETMGASEQKARIEKAVKALERQVNGGRRTDRWAWADLGECLMLLGNHRAGEKAYERFKELGDSQSAASAKAVMVSLKAALEKRADGIAESVKRGIELLEW